jgi:hypothetical protein
MSYHVISRTVWQALVDAYRSCPGSVAHAAKAAQVARATARKAWFFGLRAAPEGCREPIMAILEREQVTARARLEDERVKQAAIEAEHNRVRRQAEEEKARRDATDARVQEARIVRMARGSAGNLMASLGKMTEGVDKLCAQLNTQLNMWAQPRLNAEGQPVKMSAVELRTTTQFLATLSTAVRQVNEAGAKAIEMERVLLGEPTHIVGVQNVSAMTYADMERTVRLGMLAVERAKARGLVVDATPALGPAQPVAIVDDQSKACVVGAIKRGPSVEKGQEVGVAHDGHGATGQGDACGATSPQTLPSTSEKSSIGMGNDEKSCGATGVTGPDGRDGVKGGPGGGVPTSITGEPLPAGAHPFPSDALAGIGVGQATREGAGGKGAVPRQAGNLKVVAG